MVYGIDGLIIGLATWARERWRCEPFHHIHVCHVAPLAELFVVQVKAPFSGRATDAFGLRIKAFVVQVKAPFSGRATDAFGLRIKAGEILCISFKDFWFTLPCYNTGGGRLQKIG